MCLGLILTALLSLKCPILRYKILRMVNFQALDTIFVLALEPTRLSCFNVKTNCLIGTSVRRSSRSAHYGSKLCKTCQKKTKSFFVYLKEEVKRRDSPSV